MIDSSEKLYIGLVGEKGGGKETFVKIFRGIFPITPIGHIRFSDLLGETLELWGISKTRENYQDLPVTIENRFGQGLLAKVIRKRALENSSQIVILDGLRWLQDEEMIRILPNNFLIYITAPADLRYARLKGRKEKAGEEMTSWEQFLKEETAENEIYIPKIGANADWKIVNDRSEEAFKNEILKFCIKKILT